MKKAGKRIQTVDPATIRRAIKDVINNNTILRMSARNFGIEKKYNKRHLLVSRARKLCGF
jgi:hypothetical protein